MDWSYNLRKEKQDRRASSMTSYTSGTLGKRNSRRWTTTAGIGSGSERNREKTDVKRNNKKSGRKKCLHSKLTVDIAGTSFIGRVIRDIIKDLESSTF